MALDPIVHEGEVLKNAPVIKPIVGNIMLCALCGKPGSRQNMHAFDEHVPGGTRMACGGCNPGRANG